MSFKSVVSKVVHFVKHANAKVSSVFIELFGPDAAAAFGHASLDILKSAEGQIVVKAVEAAETITPALNGDHKYEQAFSAVGAELKAQSKSVPVSIINMLIEVAVAAAKNHFADSGVKFGEGVGEPAAPAQAQVPAVKK